MTLEKKNHPKSALMEIVPYSVRTIQERDNKYEYVPLQSALKYKFGGRIEGTMGLATK